jgi:RimJ/RimL family protein N-acetyltransferase
MRNIVRNPLVEIRNVFKFVEQNSWLELSRRIWIALTSWFFENRSMFIMKLLAEEAGEPDPSLEIKELALSDIDQILAVMYFSRAEICRRFGRGDRCFAVIDGGEIATYFWARFGVWRLNELFLEFKLKPNQAWFINAFTVKSARGRGYYPNIIRYMSRTLASEDFDEFFVNAEERNRASIRGIEKAGFKRMAKVQMKKLLSKARYKMSIFNRKGWEKLSEMICNFPNKQYVTEEYLNGSRDS